MRTLVHVGRHTFARGRHTTNKNVVVPEGLTYKKEMSQSCRIFYTSQEFSISTKSSNYKGSVDLSSFICTTVPNFDYNVRRNSILGLIECDLKMQIPNSLTFHCRNFLRKESNLLSWILLPSFASKFQRDCQLILQTNH